MTDSSLGFADGVDALAEEELKLEAQATQLIKTAPMISRGRSK